MVTLENVIKKHFGNTMKKFKFIHRYGEVTIKAINRLSAEKKYEAKYNVPYQEVRLVR